MKSLQDEMDGNALTGARGTDKLLRVKLYTSWEDLQAIRSSWDQILKTAEGPTIFSTFEWLSSWWKEFGRSARLVMLVFLDFADEIEGLVPLQRDFMEGPLRKHLRRLRFAGDGSEDSDNLDFILRMGIEDAGMRALLAWLEANGNWDLCELNTLAANSRSVPALLAHLKSRGWTYRVQYTPCSAITLPQSWEIYIEQISKKERSKINYYMGRLKKRYEVRIYKCTEAGELPGSLEALFQLHQLRWQVRGRPGTFASQERRAFYFEIARSFLERRWLEFWLLELDGNPVAAQFGFRYANTVFSLQEGFDPSYSADRVGYLLRAHVLKQLIEEGVRRYDFLGGEDPSKNRWGAQVGEYTNIHFARPLSLGSLYLRLVGLAHFTKEWLRGHLPPRVFDALRSSYRKLAGRNVRTQE